MDGNQLRRRISSFQHGSATRPVAGMVTRLSLIRLASMEGLDRSGGSPDDRRAVLSWNASIEETSDTWTFKSRSTIRRRTLGRGR